MCRSILWLICLVPSALCAQVPFDGALGVNFEMSESDLNSLGFTKLWSPQKLKHVGLYSRLSSSEYFSMIRVGVSPKDGVIYWVEGGKVFADSDLETCDAHLRTIEGTIRRKYSKLVALRRPAGQSSRSISYCEATKPGFLNTLTLCQGRHISLRCIAMDSPSTIDKSHEDGMGFLLLVRYSKSTDETKRLYNEISAYRREHRKRPVTTV